jgi:hypothetical protein
MSIFVVVDNARKASVMVCAVLFALEANRNVRRHV